MDGSTTMLLLSINHTLMCLQTDRRSWDDHAASALEAVEQMAALRVFQLEVCSVPLQHGPL